MRVRKLSIAFALCCATFAPLLIGQQATGSMLGTITDPSGGAVPDAEVTVTNRDTSTKFATLSDASGVWRAPQLPPGVYDVTLRAKGFATLVRQAIEVRVADRLRVDFALQVGSMNDTVAVNATTPLLQVEDATLGQVVDNKNIVELPLNGRNWQQLANLAPATVAAAGGTAPTNIGGLRSNQTQYFLDGSDDTNLINGGTGFNPPVDALQEFKVQTNDFTADSAGFSGGVLNAVIKSGSNSFHGNAYEFVRNNVFNARNFFTVPTQAKPEFNRNQFGASIGGPLWKNRLFFFQNYDATRQRQAAVTSTTVFSAAQKTGDFSSAVGAAAGTDATGATVYAGMIYDPFSLQTVNGTAVRTPFPGNVIPSSKINPVSSKLIALAPLPELPGSPNFIRSVSNPLDSDNFVGRVDFTLSSKDTFFTHITYLSQWNTTQCLFDLPLCGGVGAGGINNAENRQYTAAWTHVFTPATINEFQVGYVRSGQYRDLLGSNTDYNGQYGIPFPFQGPHMGSLAYLGISGYTGFGAAGTGGPYFQFVNKFEVSDNLTLVRGSHSLKFGFDGRLKLFHNQWSSNYGHGQEDFTGVFTRQPGFPNTGNSVADFLMGTAYDAYYGNIVHEKDVWRDIEGYAQDKWLATPKLTVSMGVRYFYNPPSFEARDQVASVQVGPGYHNATIIVPQGMDDATFNLMANNLFAFMPVKRAPDLTRGLTYSIHGSFAPRLGIAYQLNPKLVIRGGYGIFYGFPENVGGNILGVNPPSRLVLSSVTNGINPTLLIDQAAFGSSPFVRTLTTPDFLSVRDPYSPPEMTNEYNFTIQYEFLHNWLVEVGYLGNHGAHIYLNTQINDATPALPNDNSSVQSRRIASPLLGSVPWYAPQGNSTYNALTINVEHRFTTGFSLLANYTQSRAIGNTDAGAKSPYDLRDSYGPLSFDVRRHFTSAIVYELPFGTGKPLASGVSHALNQVIGGWQLDSIVTLQGGLRGTPSLTYSLGKTATNSRPDVIGDPTQGAARQPYQWINAAAFSIPSNAQIIAGDFFGNAGAGIIAYPGMVNFDFSVLKNFVIKERIRAQFRTEFFNFTNTPYFGAPGLQLGTPTFGKITSAADPRILQLGLKLAF